MKTNEKTELLNCVKRVFNPCPYGSVWQIRCFVFAIKYLQPLFDEKINWIALPLKELEEKLNVDHNCDFLIPINVKSIDNGNKHVAQVLNEIKRMMDVLIPWEYELDGKKEINHFRFIHRMKIDENDNLFVAISPIAARWAMEMNKKQEYLTFHRNSIICLSSAFSMKFFALLSQWYNKHIFSINIEKLCSILDCPQYDSYDIKRKILVPIQEEFIEKENCILMFKFVFKKDNTVRTRGRKKCSTLYIKIYDKRNAREVEDYEYDNWEVEFEKTLNAPVIKRGLSANKQASVRIRLKDVKNRRLCANNK